MVKIIFTDLFLHLTKLIHNKICDVIKQNESELANTDFKI